MLGARRGISAGPGCPIGSASYGAACWSSPSCMPPRLSSSPRHTKGVRRVPGSALATFGPGFRIIGPRWCCSPFRRSPCRWWLWQCAEHLQHPDIGLRCLSQAGGVV